MLLGNCQLGMQAGKRGQAERGESVVFAGLLLSAGTGFHRSREIKKNITSKIKNREGGDWTHGTPDDDH